MKSAYFLWLMPGFGIFASAQMPAPTNQPPLNDAQMLSDAVSALKTTDTALSAKLAQVAAKPSGETGVPGLPSQPTPSADIQTIHQAASELY